MYQKNVRYKCNEKMYIRNVMKKWICNKYHKQTAFSMYICNAGRNM